jgi:hypothetical protein
VNERSWTKTATLTALIVLCLSEPAAAQLPFDIDQEDLIRLRNLYRREHEREPVTLQLTVRCPAYRAVLGYDGVVARLELRDVATGELVYQGRRRGFP